MKNVRAAAVIIWLIILSGIIITLFWHNELVYALPTPIPKNYISVNPGKEINLPSSFQLLKGKPVFLHFFNPDCPCSKFNITYFKSLLKQYGSRVSFAIVVMSKKQYSAREIQNRISVDVPISFDTSIARLCGVYSTPQAVIIDTAHKLYYRGNYNRSRYCMDPKSEYAQIALEDLLNKHTFFSNQDALKSYGCQLFNFTK